MHKKYKQTLAYTKLLHFSIIIFLSYLSSNCRHNFINYAGVQICDYSSSVRPSVHTLTLGVRLMVGQFSCVSLVSVDVGIHTLAQVCDASAQRPQKCMRSARVPPERAALGEHIHIHQTLHHTQDLVSRTGRVHQRDVGNGC